jgi:type II secretory pathway component PulL
LDPVWRSTKLENLRQRSAAVDRLVDRQAAVHREAAAYRLAHPDSVDALLKFEAAEERYTLVKMSQQKARRALQRAERRHAAVSYLFSWLTTGRGTRRSIQ